MKNKILLTLSVIAITTFVNVQSATAQEVMEAWPGVTIKVLAENENVKVFRVTFAKGAVADWHEHPEYTAYAVTNATIKAEEKGKEPAIMNLTAGQAVYSPAVMHKTTNIGKKKLTLIVTEIK